MDINGRCKACAAGYYRRDGKCYACDASCKTCNDPNFCLTCANEYYDGDNGDYALCLACPTGC